MHEEVLDEIYLSLTLTNKGVIYEKLFYCELLKIINKRRER